MIRGSASTAFGPACELPVEDCEDICARIHPDNHALPKSVSMSIIHYQSPADTTKHNTETELSSSR